MRAVVLEEFGPPTVLHLRDLPSREPNAGEVVVDVVAAGINPVDWKTRSGRGLAGRLPPPPLVLGWDVAGVVRDVATDVESLKPGDRVFGMVRFPDLGAAYAEEVVAPAEHLCRVPDGLGLVEAAALPLAGLTAYQNLVELAHVRPGQRVLVHAAAGGVGHLAVQLAVGLGAYTIGTASASNASFLRELGCAEVIDYSAGPFEQAVEPVDVVLDALGGDTLRRSVDVLVPGGVLLTLPTKPDWDPFEARGVRGRWQLVRPDWQGLRQLAVEVEQGRLHPHVSEVLPLKLAAKAHELGESGHVRGKLVLSMD